MNVIKSIITNYPTINIRNSKYTQFIMEASSTIFSIFYFIIVTVILIQAQNTNSDDGDNRYCNSIDIDGIFYKVSITRNSNKTSNNIHIINGRRYQFMRRNVKNRDSVTMNNNIYTDDGTVYEMNQKLYLDSIKFNRSILIKTVNENSKYDLSYDSMNKKVFILPLSLLKVAQKRIVLFSVTNYFIVNNTIQTTLITLPTCSINAIAVEKDTGSILLSARENGKPVLILLEAHQENPCFVQTTNDNKFTTYMKNITDYTIKTIKQSCLVRPQAVKHPRKTQRANELEVFLNNFKTYMNDLYKLHNEHVQENQELCMRTCPHVDTLKEDEILKAENKNLSTKITQIIDKLKQFQNQIHIINSAIKQLPFNTYQNMTVNKIQSTIQNQDYECFLQSEVEAFDESNNDLFETSESILENLEALENEATKLIASDDNVVVEVE
ncbi:uncharacterized protein LOC143909740 [Arctopsyche grandis]|uniref:uncharacterized protein LOC143909740 n=1 Tax=Arctopsyche grandis TaxID=121162 RepID=UPI00406D95EC